MYNHKSGGRALKEGWKPDPESGLYPTDNYNCSTYYLTAKRSERKCFGHYITTRAVRALILDTIRTVSAYAISDEKGFVEKIRAASQLQQDNAAKELKRKLNRDRKRSAELDGLIKKLYADFVFLSLKIAIFTDGCFWHGHDCRNLSPAANSEYWSKKIERNRLRDKKITALFQARNWTVIRIWECEFKYKSVKAKEKLQILLAKLQESSSQAAKN